MRIMSHDVKLQAYSYQRTSELEHKFREVIVAEEGDRINEDEDDILDATREKQNRGSKVENDLDIQIELLKMSLIEIWIQALTGQKFKFQRNLNLDTNAIRQEFQLNRLQMQMQVKEATVLEYHEEERMNVHSDGLIQTESGEEIEFTMNLHFSRTYYESHVTAIEMGVANLKDPLVINLDGKGVGFSDKKLQIDLNMDGKIDEFNRLNAGNGFLAFDKNGNGKIDDGSELFGPETGYGFDELEAYDEDGNQWIDENDPIFDDLRVWQIDEDGEQHLLALKDAEVGAIYLGSVGSKFDIKQGKDLIARITDSSVYLKENGMAQAVQQVDLNVQGLVAAMSF